MESLSIAEALEFLVKHRKYLTTEHKNTLSNLSSGASQGNIQTLDIVKEVQEQLRVVRNMRIAIDQGDHRAVKDLVSVSTSLLTLLTKLQGEIVTRDRLRRIEEVTVETIKVLPPESQQEFFSRMEQALNAS